MALKKSIRLCLLAFAAIILSVLITGCAKQKTESGDESFFTSFREIPGVTVAETENSEELQSRGDHFSYASFYGTEMFYDENGEAGGFSVLICEWLSEMFDIPFIPCIVEWDELVKGLENGEIDFTGELTANKERREKYSMTDDIAQRRIIKIHMADETTLQGIAETRPLRYAFLYGATTADIVSQYERQEFETYFVSEFEHAYRMLENREVDAFFSESSVEAAFNFHDEVVVSTYFPIIYSPISLTTSNPDLKPIIDIVQKALENGAINHLTRLYNQGRQSYQRYKLFLLLTDEERDYIKNNPVVPYAAEITNYPVSFYDTRTRQWEGIAHDVIREMESSRDFPYGLSQLRTRSVRNKKPPAMRVRGRGYTKKHQSFYNGECSGL